ncbi:proteasome subunit alpha type 1, partial [Moniliophthora roreri]
MILFRRSSSGWCPLRCVLIWVRRGIPRPMRVFWYCWLRRRRTRRQRRLRRCIRRLRKKRIFIHDEVYGDMVL